MADTQRAQWWDDRELPDAPLARGVMSALAIELGVGCVFIGAWAVWVLAGW